MTWLDSVGGVEVERITNVKRSFQSADRVPPKAVLHTTEGSWAGSLSVFRYTTGTPTFMIGRDGSTRLGSGYNGRLRIAQFMPIGEMALTLKNGSGSPETNRDCVAQIELVAHCQWQPWLPDEATTKLLASLMAEIKRVAGVPLVRGGDDSRSVTRWNTKAGWFGHSEVPENDHTDPRAIKWGSILTGGQVQDDNEEVPEVFPPWFAPWKKWYILGRPRGVPMPSIAGLPADIPQWAFEDVGDTVAIHRLLGPPVQYLTWRNGRLIGTPMPENLPSPVPEGWWEGAVIDHKFANDFSDKADDPLQQQLAAKMQEVVSLQNALASAQAELENAQQNDNARVAELEAEVARVRSLLVQALAEIDG